MIAARIAMASLALALAGPAAAKEAAQFVVKLGSDTTSIESYVRTPDRLEVKQVGRSPRVLRRHFVYEMKKGELTQATMIVAPPDSDTPTQKIEAKVDGDSIRVATTTPENTSRSSAWFPKGTVAFAGSSPWSVYEGQIMKLVASKADTASTSAYALGATSPQRLRFEKKGSDVVTVQDVNGNRYDAKIDKQGRILSVTPLPGTQLLSVSREDKLDVAAYATNYGEREKVSGRMGALSPRDTLLATFAGANFTVDYSRPSKRGRQIFGGIVPYGQVWRTGANAATTFKTDKDLVMNGTNVPAGFYTIWAKPDPQGWKLIINSETGQAGTARNPDKDLYTIDMQVTTLPAVVERFTIGFEPGADGGKLNLDWDTTRASVAFTVKP